MKRMVFSGISLFTFMTALSAAEITGVVVRQQWPWSTDIKVSFRLSGAEEPVDIRVGALNGMVPCSVPANALRGDLHGLTAADGEVFEGSFVIDPVVAFGTKTEALADFRVTLSAEPSPANINEVLYKIFDLNDGSCTDVTRRELLDRKYGTVETSYAAIDPSFSTPLDDVLIWTGVTNNPAYKTTKLVMRKIPAKDAVWQSGDPSGTLCNHRTLFERYWVKLTYDYYIAVFEMTQAQYKSVVGSMYGAENCEFTDDPQSPHYPVNHVGRYNVLGHPTNGADGAKGVVTGEQIIFPHNTYVRDVGKDSFLARMWKKTGVEFNMPTGAEWEFACRGGNDTPLYSGESQTEANVSKLAWHRGVSGNRPLAVGSLAPNAYGVYDMLGNVFEFTTMSGNFSQGGERGTGAGRDDPVVNPLGNPNSTANTHYSSAGTSFYNVASTWEYYGDWEDCRASVRCGNFNWFGTFKYVGFRVVMPATADGLWAAHPVKAQ